ncbi:hypothetical protein [Neoroseomonas soli]|uniref:Uncharacterized protein n=1 Tax=Neoroseomonas soli TaxID=1081025 RepID=A0A9X9X355_9PROT|nr:hypothetical protein [Neoroseomonas soli]MBR0673834.1 hypothetical protein [Neoroseomonas soli]
MTNITLKRAADIARAALDAANAIPLAAQVNLSIHVPDVAAAATQATRAFDEGLADYEALLQAHFAIRALIGAANARSGLDDLLARRANLEALEKKLAGIADKVGTARDTAENLAVANAGVASAKQRVAAGHDLYRGEEVVLPLVDRDRAERIAARRAEVRRERADIADAVAGASTSTPGSRWTRRPWRR